MPEQTRGIPREGADVGHVGLRGRLRRLHGQLAAAVARSQRGRSSASASLLGLRLLADDELVELLRGLDTLDVETRDARCPPQARITRALLSDGPWLRLERVFSLSPLECDLLTLALCVELDPRYARLIAYLNDDAQQVRPTVGTAVAVIGSEADGTWAIQQALQPDATLRDWGLIECEGEGPFPTHPLRVPTAIWRRLAELQADEPSGENLPIVVGALDRVICAEEVRVAARALVERTRSRLATEPPVVVVRGAAGSGRDTLAAAIASEWGYQSLFLSTGQLSDVRDAIAWRRDAAWFGAALIIRAGRSELPDALREELEHAPTPIFWVTSEPSNWRGRRTVVELAVPRPGARERRALWLSRLAASEQAAGVDLDALAERYQFGPAEIGIAVDRARQQARLALDENAPLGAAELQEACLQLRGDHFGALAERLECPYEPGDLVVPEQVRRELDLAGRWARHGTQVLDGWGLARRVPNGRSLACLFGGPPGTGKTMAAQILARQLGAALYRVDLSQIVNKYIGETEKNLGKVFDSARGEHVVLFFDEADALFGKRTEVRDAHDRYANVETGYLLQRLEQHHGVVVLATNLRRNIDEAFLRRLHVVVDFPMPNAADRLRLWESFLPPSVPRGADVDLSFLAQRFAVAGGDIRNAVLCAAFQAAGDGGAVEMRHLVFGVWRELQKGGRLVEPAEFGPWSHAIPEPQRSARSRSTLTQG